MLLNCQTGTTAPGRVVEGDSSRRVAADGGVIMIWWRKVVCGLALFGDNGALAKIMVTIWRYPGGEKMAGSRLSRHWL